MDNQLGKNTFLRATKLKSRSFYRLSFNGGRGQTKHYTAKLEFLSRKSWWD